METSLNHRFAEIQLEGLKQFRDELNEEIASLERVVNQFNSNSVQTPTEGTYTAELTNAIYELLIEERPLHRRTILDRLEAKDIFVGGSNKLRTLSAHLSHDGRFTPTERGFWTLANPPVNDEIVRITNAQSPFLDDNRVIRVPPTAVHEFVEKLLES